MTKLILLSALTFGSIYGAFNAIDSVSSVAADRSTAIEQFSE